MKRRNKNQSLRIAGRKSLVLIGSFCLLVASAGNALGACDPPAGVGGAFSLGGSWKIRATWNRGIFPSPGISTTICNDTVLTEFTTAAGSVGVTFNGRLDISDSGVLSASVLGIGNGLTLPGEDRNVGSVSVGGSLSVERIIIGRDPNFLDPVDAIAGSGTLSIDGNVSVGSGGVTVSRESRLSIGSLGNLTISNGGGLGIAGTVELNGPQLDDPDVIEAGNLFMSGSLGIQEHGNFTMNAGKLFTSFISAVKGSALFAQGATVTTTSGGVAVGRRGSIQFDGFGTTADIFGNISLADVNEDPNFAGVVPLTVSGGAQINVAGTISLRRGGSLTVDGPGSLVLATDSALNLSNTAVTTTNTGTVLTPPARVTVSNGAGLFVRSAELSNNAIVQVLGGALSVAGDFVIGRRVDVIPNQPAGELRVFDGGKVSSNTGFVGRTLPESDGSFHDGRGRVIINGAGSEWRIAQALTIGQNSAYIDPRIGEIKETAEVSIQNGGLLAAQVVSLGDPPPSGLPARARTSVIAIGSANGLATTPGRLEIADDINIGRYGALVFNHLGTNYEFDTALESIGAQDGVIEHRDGITRMTGRLDRFTGDIEVTGGSLSINVDAGATTTTVSNTGHLGGIGSVAGTVRVNNGGNLFGGQDNNPFTMTTLVLSSGAAMNVALESLSPVPIFDVRGDVSLDGTINVNASDLLGIGLYRILNYGGTLVDRGLNVGNTGGLNPDDFSVFLGGPGAVSLVYSGGLGGTPFMGDGNGSLRIGGGGWTDVLGNPSTLSRGDAVILNKPASAITLDDSGGELALAGIQFAGDGIRLAGDALTVESPMQIRVGDGTQNGKQFVGVIDAPLVGANDIEMKDLGTLQYLGDGSNYSGVFTVNGGHLALAGKLGGILVIGPDALLSGTGTTADLLVLGTLAPGNSPGTLVVDGNYTQDPAGTLVIELGGDPQSGLFDRLQVSGEAALGGTLQIVLVDGFQPVIGNVFDIILATAISGEFDQIVMPAGFNFALANLGTRLQLSVVSAVPVPMSLVLFAPALVLLRRRCGIR